MPRESCPVCGEELLPAPMLTSSWCEDCSLEIPS